MKYLKNSRDFSFGFLVIFLNFIYYLIYYRRDVSLEEGEAFAKKYGFMFTEGSAKTGNNIEYSYSELAKKILRKIENNEIDLTNEVTINIKKKIQIKCF